MAIAKWWKIDFHTHTPASECFTDKTKLATDWVNSAINAGLHGVVVTDHNSMEWIENLRNATSEIKETEPEKNLVIYPGVELCVGLEFIHILIVFDPNTNISLLQSFITQCDIVGSDVGNTLKTVSVEKLAELCDRYDFLVIPAHFNKNKGLGRININGIREFANTIPIAAIEVRDDSDIREVNNKFSNKAFKEMPVLVTGSDNPGKKQGEHSIEGLGQAYTWVQLSEHSLESLRQAFLDFTRIKCVLENDTEQNDPNNVTHNYIAGMSIKNLKHIKSLDFYLSPHLNCIIGGRGSGKSTIIEMARMTLDRVDEKKGKNFPLINDVTTEESEVDVYYNFGNVKEFKITSKGKKERIWRYVDANGSLQEYPDFPVSIFSQKDIYNLVDDDIDSDKRDRSPILEIIDENIMKEKSSIESQIDTLEHRVLSLSQTLYSLRKEMQEIPKVKAEIEIANSKLDLFNNTGIIDIKTQLDIFNADTQLLESVINEIKSKFIDIDISVNQLIDKNLNYLNQEIKLDVSKEVCNSFEDIIKNLKNNLFQFLESAKSDVDKLDTTLNTSKLKGNLTKIELEYHQAFESMQGINIENYKDTATDKETNTNRLKDLIEKEPREKEILEEIEDILNKIEEKQIELNALRNNVVSQIQERARNIGLNVHLMSHKDRWLPRLRKDMGKLTVFEEEFIALSNWIFPGGILDKEKWRMWNRFLLTFNLSLFEEVLKDSSKKVFVDKFEKMWETKYKDKTLSSLFSISPEDRVEITIKNNGTEIGINDGSPGQKSAAVLAFILNQGTKPLVIDQPEDDLDNSLIIELIVENIRNMKSSRQIIIVTHNPNIPVLGDAEGIIMLDRANDGTVIFKGGKKTGCIEESSIKKGICDIMEGGITAFKRREAKYKNIDKY